MRYYKIIRNGQIIGAGTMFLKWFPRTGKYYYCDFDQAQAVQDVITENLYTDDWLHKAPVGAEPVETAEVDLISEEEYDEIIEQLTDGEPISVPEEPEPPVTEEPVPEEATEERMTISDMRSKITEMENMLNIIMGVVE